MDKAEEKFNKAIGRRISQAQTAASIEDTEVLSHVGITINDLRAYKGGRSMRPFRLDKFADALNVSADYLMGREKARP